MDDFRILKEIGLKEVSNKTHIEVEFLKYIIDKDFAKLMRVNARGYIKILEREYNVDFQTWEMEFKEFCEQNKKYESKKTIVNPKISSYTNGHNDGGKFNFSFIFWIVLIVLFVFVAYFSGIYDYAKNLFSNQKIDQNISSNIYQSNFDDNDSIVNIIDSNSSQNTDEQVQYIDKLEQDNQNNFNFDKSQEVEDKQLNLENISDHQKLKDSNLTNQSSLNDADLTNEIISKNQNIKILPKSRVWIGIKDLKTNDKISKVISDDYEIDYNKDQLIVLGNGNIKLEIDGKTHTFNSSKTLRFVIKNGEFKGLSYDEFLTLNNGKSW